MRPSGRVGKNGHLSRQQLKKHRFCRFFWVHLEDLAQFLATVQELCSQRCSRIVMRRSDATIKRYHAPLQSCRPEVSSQAAKRFENMSLSRETIDQLLSGHMDGALSDAERTQLDELLQSDPNVARELDELCQLRDSLQFISRADSTINLDEGFADRVLDAAVQRARAEGLGEDHPVVRLAEQPISGTRSKSIPVWRIAGAVAALAASIALAVFFLSPETGNNGIQTLADSGLVADLPELDATNSDSDPSTQAIASNDREIDAAGSLAIDSVERSAMLDSAVASTDVSDGTNTAEQPEVAPAKTRIDEPRPDSSAVASSQPIRKQTNEPTIDVSPQRKVGAVMVLDVYRTESGRLSRAVRSALTTATIKIQNEKLIAEDIVGVMEKSEHESTRGASVLYLEGTAKELDRFILTLCADRQGIESVHFGIASELPILNLVKKLQRPIDPKTVRHSASWSVQGESEEATRIFTGALVDRPMAPLGVDTTGLGVFPNAKEDGPDVMSELFVVIR